MTGDVQPGHVDWLYQHLDVSGEAGAVAAFRAAAAGAGVVPWRLDGERIEEALFLRLVTAVPRTLSLEGSRRLAAALRAAMERRQALAVALVGRNRACPFDLHALVPVPAAVLALGPDDPAALEWLWTSWGTPEALRHVTVQERPGGVRFGFWSADWTPWRALVRVRAAWPGLHFAVRPDYGAGASGAV